LDTPAEVHSKRGRIGIGLMVAGIVVLALGVFYFSAWLQTYQGIVDAAESGNSVWIFVEDSKQYGYITIATFVFGIPLLLIGLVQVWLASRRNALIEGAMIERLLSGSERGRPDQTPTQ